jgi:hypothetical protein
MLGCMGRVAGTRGVVTWPFLRAALPARLLRRLLLVLGRVV